ncbi:MAG TPA: hypothetical protein VFV79_07940 [Saprospiraceae bacterium]|nr:hypothetical protein [Saprospiraceae bacterium]
MNLNARTTALNTAPALHTVKARMSRLHEVSQNSLRSKTLKGKKHHHPTQRPGDPYSIHHARPFYVLTFQEDDMHALRTLLAGTDTPIYIGRLHPSDHISRIFHPPTV